MVRDEVIAEILRSRSSLDDAAKRLVNTANEAGGRDNVTVVLFRIGEEADAQVEEEMTQTHLRVEDVRDAVAATAPAAEAPKPARPPAPRVPGPPPKRRVRAAVTAFLVLLSIAVLIAGFWFGSRQFYFVGTNSSGLIVLYQGVPLDLPGDFSMYSPVYTSTVPAAGLPARQRAAVLNHGLRTKGDATELVRSLEEQQTSTRPSPGGNGSQGNGGSGAKDSRAKDSGGGSSGGRRNNGAR
jgi:protein phosphatase